MSKIVGGDLKGRSIKIPKTKLTRPSTSYSRKVIFDTISSLIKDSIVLDLFAGSGSLGIEAISRGANEVYFVDENQKPINTLKENVNTLKIEAKCKIIKQDAVKYIKKNQEPLDIIFIDPPYAYCTSKLKTIFDTIKDKELLKQNGIICLEIPTRKSKEIQTITLSKYSIYKEKKKGETTLLFIKD